MSFIFHQIVSFSLVGSTFSWPEERGKRKNASRKKMLMAEKCTNKYKHYSLRRRHRPSSSKHVPQKKHSLTGSRAPHSIRTAALFFALLALQNLLEKKGGKKFVYLLLNKPQLLLLLFLLMLLLLLPFDVIVDSCALALTFCAKKSQKLLTVAMMDGTLFMN